MKGNMMDGQEKTHNEPPDLTDAERIRSLGRRIQQKRVAERLTLEQAAEQSGVSAATLSRLERQAGMKTTKRFITPDTRTISALVRWMGESLNTMLETPTLAAPPVPSHIVEGEGIGGLGMNTPEAVEVYLRADRNLSPEVASMLAKMFRLAYEQYSRLSESQQAPKPHPPSGGEDQGT